MYKRYILKQSTGIERAKKDNDRTGSYTNIYEEIKKVKL